MQRDDFAVKAFPGIETVGLEAASHPVRVCIATEEIIGPVRNGGIASTYYHLAKGLAARGHEVHVLFLKGPVVQDETPEHWVAHFAGFGVTLHYLDIPEGKAWGASPFWQTRYLAAYRWLRDRPPFDVVHTSEWRGGMMYALMAKRLGLAFDETLFLVKTSSPHIWNRHYQMQPIDKADLVAACYAEQKCVELADVVIGGSAHLITFMGEIGYRVPDANVFVQPNIVDFSEVPVTDLRPPRAPGDVVHTDELVFFGRLEGRKGLELFCNALDILVHRGQAPRKVTFMGKFGGPLASQGGRQGADYLKEKCAAWPFETEVVTGKNQPEALSHMCSRDMVAVMPSLIENSTMAVYETLEKRIPFIATAVGGTPELIDPADHAACLVAPTSQDLADRMAAALTGGHPIARPSFSNDANLDIWYGFHNFLGARMAAEGRGPAIAALTAARRPEPAPVQRLSVVALVRDAADVEGFAGVAAAAGADECVLVFADAGMQAAVEAAAAAAPAEMPVRACNCIGLASGDALNAGVAEASGDALLVCLGGAARPRPGYAAAAKAALSHRPDAIFTTLFADADGHAGLPIGGDAASQFFAAAAYGPEAVALTRARFDALGRLEPYDLPAGLIHDLVGRQVAAGEDLYVYPETLLDWTEAGTRRKAWLDDPVYYYMKSKALLDRADLPTRKVLLHALSTGRLIAQRGSLDALQFGSAEGLNIPERVCGVYDGHVLALLGTVEATADPVTVTLIVDGVPAWTGPIGTGAQYFHPDLAAGAVAVPVEALAGISASDDLREVILHRSDTDKEVSGTIRLPAVPRFDTFYNGAVQQAETPQVGGWVYARNCTAPLEVAVYVDGRYCAHLTADRERESLDRPCAFNTRIDARHLRSDGAGRIDVVVAESGMALRKSPLMLSGSGLTELTGPQATGKRAVVPALDGVGLRALVPLPGSPAPAMAETQICGVRNGFLLATFAGANATGALVGVEAVVSGKVVWTGLLGSGATMVLPTLAANSVAVPLDTLAPHLGGSGTVTLRRTDGRDIASGPVCLPHHLTFEDLYSGACEGRDVPAIRGWVRRKEGDDVLDVSVYVQGRFAAKLRADRARASLPTACGFFGPLEAAFLDGVTEPKIEVLVSESGLPVRRSPLRYSDGAVHVQDGEANPA